MDDTVYAEVHLDEGRLVLTGTHFLLLDKKGRRENLFNLTYVTAPSFEIHHSFRHRGCGIIAAGIFFSAAIAGLVPCAADVGGLKLEGRFAIGSLFALIFGVMFLVGVLRSRRIFWLRFNYANVARQIPLPGADVEALQKFLRLLEEWEESNRKPGQ
jgi:hypothetical protein